MDGVIYAKHWIEDIVWEMNTDEEDTTSEVRSSSKDKRNKGFIAHIDKLRSYLDAPEEIHLGRKPEDLLETLVNMVLGSPAICIYRSNGRSTARATSLAKVFVNNFNLRSQQLSLILLMADAGMIIPTGRMYLNTVKMAVFRQ